MRWSYKLMRAFGIDIRVHVTFLLIVAYFAFVWGVLMEPGGLGGALYGVTLVVLLFGLVVIHELSHSRVAQAYGIEVTSITLLPIGGMANMGEIPEDPRQELAISIVGPVSNLVIAALMAIGAVLFVDLGDLSDWDHVTTLLLGTGFKSAYLYLMTINVMLAAFNLLPAFPMDGGRVFRSFLSMRMSREKATRAAVAVGQGLAIVMGLVGILGGGIILILIAIFVYFGAQAEGQQEQVRAVLGDLRVRQAVNTDIEVASPRQTLGELAARLFHIYQEDFPVVDDDGEVIGILTRDGLISALGEYGAGHRVTEAMRREFPDIYMDQPVFEAFNALRQAGTKAAPVLVRGRLAGMLSLEDISEVYSLLSSGGPELARRVPAADEEGPYREGRYGGGRT